MLCVGVSILALCAECMFAEGTVGTNLNRKHHSKRTQSVPVSIPTGTVNATKLSDNLFTAWQLNHKYHSTV